MDGVSEDTAERARRRAAEAGERAREAGERVAELRAGQRPDAESPLSRSHEAVVRAAWLAREGYRHAAEAERAAAAAHQTVAESIDARAQRNPEEGEELGARAMRHRDSAGDHLRRAEIDESRHAELEQDSDAGDEGETS